VNEHVLNVHARVVHRWPIICIRRLTRNDVRCSSSSTWETDSLLKPTVRKLNC